MKRLLTLALLGLVLTGCAPGLSGCGTVLDPNAGVLTFTLADEKALYAAEAAFYGANAAAEAAVDNRVIVAGSPRAVQIADALAQGRGALLAARAAHKAGDAKGYGEKLAAVQGFVAAAWALLPARPSV